MTDKTDIRDRLGDLEKSTASLDRDIAVASASFTILHEELSSKVLSSIQQSDDRRIENQNARIELVKLAADIESLKSRIEASDATAADLAVIQQRNAETSTKLKWGLATAIAIAVINGVFAILKGIL